VPGGHREEENVGTPGTTRTDDGKRGGNKRLIFLGATREEKGAALRQGPIPEEAGQRARLISRPTRGREIKIA